MFPPPQKKKKNTQPPAWLPALTSPSWNPRRWWPWEKKQPGPSKDQQVLEGVFLFFNEPQGLECFGAFFWPPNRFEVVFGCFLQCFGVFFWLFLGVLECFLVFFGVFWSVFLATKQV